MIAVGGLFTGRDFFSPLKECSQHEISSFTLPGHDNDYNTTELCNLIKRQQLAYGSGRPVLLHSIASALSFFLVDDFEKIILYEPNIDQFSTLIKVMLKSERAITLYHSQFSQNAEFSCETINVNIIHKFLHETSQFFGSAEYKNYLRSKKFKERVILIYGPQFEISEVVKGLPNKKILCNEIEHNSIYSNPSKVRDLIMETLNDNL